MLAELSLTEHEVESAIVCVLVALLLGAAVWAAGTYLFKVAWAGVAGFLTFLVVLLLCVI